MHDSKGKECLSIVTLGIVFWKFNISSIINYCSHKHYMPRCYNAVLIVYSTIIYKAAAG